MSLPTKVSPDDLRRIVVYLRSKPAGVSLGQAAAVLKEVVGSGRIAAFSRWGFVTRRDGKIKLGDQGWCLAKGTKSRPRIMLEILDSEPAYRSAVEWIYHQVKDSVTNAEVASHWLDRKLDGIGRHQRTIREQALCMFRIAEAAGLGWTRIGRRGSLTRLNLDRASLSEFIEAGAAPAQPTPQSISDSELDRQPRDYHETLEQGPGQDWRPPLPVKQAQRLKVFVAHGKNAELVQRVGDILKVVAGIECEIATEEEATAIPVSENVFGAMKRCTASVVIVSREEAHTESGSIRIDENVLIAIVAAFVLYDRRVVLLWENGVPVPSNLQGIDRCEFDGNDLALAEVIKLTRGLRKFWDGDSHERKAG